MTMNKTFCKFTNGVSCRSIAGRGSKSISRVGIYSSKNKILPLPSWKCSSVTILPPRSWLIIWRRGPHCRLCTGLCCWRIEHSAVAVARLVLVSRHLCCCDHVYPWFLLPGHFVHEPLVNDRSSWGMVTDINKTNPVIHFCWLHVWHSYLYILGPFGEIYPHIFPWRPCHQFSNCTPSKTLVLS